jgi:hypothetical protein
MTATPWVRSTCAILCAICFAVAAPALARAQEGNGIDPAARPEAPSAPQGPVPLTGLWQEFNFTTTGVPARGCAPADPAGGLCSASSAGNSVFADAPPWTFTAGISGASLTVTDAFNNGDEFEVFDFGVSIGTTPVVANTGSCGDDPDVCVADAASSHRVYPLAPGAHSITITPSESPFSSGAAYFRVDGEIFIQEIPTLGAAGLVLLAGALGLGALLILRRSRVA